MRALPWFFLLAMAACSPSRPKEAVSEILGTQAERVASISQLLRKHASLPSALHNAHFLEEQHGDNRLGPADFTDFYALTVEPTDVAKWRTALPPLPQQNMPPGYATPKRPCSWWVTREDFSGLEFYSAKSFTGRSEGWVGIAPDGRIFVYAKTM